VTVGGKTIREHLEVLNVRDAWERLRDAMRPGTPLTEELVLGMHNILMKGILGDDAGRYRRVPVHIPGSTGVPPDWPRVPDLMAGFTRAFRARPADEHPIRFAARAHVDLVGIHPFADGNGRVARLVVNFLLMRDGWPPALYTSAERLGYLRAIRSARLDGDLDPMVRVTAEAARFMIDRYLHAIRLVREGEREGTR
jgi:Fic family protein